ncbi:MAG: ribonuclease P protein component 1 [Thermoproteota archaeon]
MSARRDESKQLARRELLSLEVEVVSSTDPTLIGKRGIVIDETKNTFIVRTSSGDKMIPKKVAVFRFFLPSGKKVMLEGRTLTIRPEDRLRS